LEKKDFIDFELHSRSLQWSFTKECPPPFTRNHQQLIAFPASARTKSFFITSSSATCYTNVLRTPLGLFSLVEEIRTFLETTKIVLAEFARRRLLRQDTVAGHRIGTPAREYDLVCERVNYRRRLRLLSVGGNAIRHAQCFGTSTVATMDEDFEFSFYKTREEFDEEERRREEFNRQFENRRKAGKYDKPFRRMAHRF